MDRIYNTQPASYADFYTTLANTLNIQPKYTTNQSHDKPIKDAWKVQTELARQLFPLPPAIKMPQTIVSVPINEDNAVNTF